MNVKNKIVLVTGAAKGIGLATVKRLLKKEAKVILWDFQADDLASTSLISTDKQILFIRTFHGRDDSTRNGKRRRR